MEHITTLEAARRLIDEIDSNLLKLLNERMEVVRRVGEIKRHTNEVIYRPEREQKIIKRLAELNAGRLNAKAIEAIFLEIFAVSRNMELAEKVAYLGPIGSFTHQAAESRFGAVSEYIPLKTIKSVFEAVSTQRVRFGVIPAENNQEGIVVDTIKLLNTSEVNIVAELAIPVHFAFASLTEELTKIKKVYSKDIAFKQCSEFIDNHLNDELELIPVNSTSTAAQLAAEDESASTLCSPIAAKLSRLPVLFENVENSADNFTRFLIISEDFKNAPSGEDKTSILVKLPSDPGSLVNFLQKFYEKGINLTKIESYPAKEGKKFKYQFLLEFDGHYEDDAVKAIMNDKNIKWLGSYPKLC